MAEINPNNYLDVEYGASGSPQCLKLKTSIVVPSGVGIIWKSSDGKYWQERQALNADGSTFYDENGKPTLEINQVTL